MRVVRKGIRTAAVMMMAAMVAAGAPQAVLAEEAYGSLSAAQTGTETMPADSGITEYRFRKEAVAPANGLERQGWIPDYQRTAPEDTLVLLLDPGHDSMHGGAQNGNLYEHELVFRIAQYCKDALEEYADVEVHLTRTSNDCPYPGSVNGDDLYQRVMQARSIGADAYISLHLNDGFQNSGSLVYVQSTSWKPQLNTRGRALGDSILKELSALGLRNEGTYSTDSASMRYPDGSRADDLTVMRASKRIDLLAVLVEHCYLSYAPDRQQYLSSEDGLRALGEADAHGIAAYFGLTYRGDTDRFEEEYAAVKEKLESADADLTPMFRLYSPRTKEHLYTSDVNEIRYLLKNRWNYESVAWYAPKESGRPVYRLFHPGSGEHFYTADRNERTVLLSGGEWKDEGIGWYSDDAQGMPVYRMYYSGLPPIASHHYTSDANEYRILTTARGWSDESIAWYGAVLP